MKITSRPLTRTPRLHGKSVAIGSKFSRVVPVSSDRGLIRNLVGELVAFHFGSTDPCRRGRRAPHQFPPPDGHRPTITSVLGTGWTSVCGAETDTDKRACRQKVYVSPRLDTRGKTGLTVIVDKLAQGVLGTFTRSYVSRD